ncbi:hypothetical protein BPY_12240 [Bifidobacterium psychraerophilum]
MQVYTVVVEGFADHREMLQGDVGIAYAGQGLEQGIHAAFTHPRRPQRGKAFPSLGEILESDVYECLRTQLLCLFCHASNVAHECHG